MEGGHVNLLILLLGIRRQAKIVCLVCLLCAQTLSSRIFAPAPAEKRQRAFISPLTLAESMMPPGSMKQFSHFDSYTETNAVLAKRQVSPRLKTITCGILNESFNCELIRVYDGRKFCCFLWHKINGFVA